MPVLGMHLNGNILAAIDTETTGLNPQIHSVWQVCVMLLDANFEPLRDVTPFYGTMRPRSMDDLDFKTIKGAKVDFYAALSRSQDADSMADFFEEWYQKLPLPFGKNLIPVAHNWPFDYSFLLAWLGWPAMTRYFHGHYRDLMVVGLYENDKANWHREHLPYNQHGLRNYCHQFGVENPNPHDALADAWSTAKCYKEIVKTGFLTPVNLQAANIPEVEPNIEKLEMLKTELGITDKGDSQ